ncbi:hypothetical protein H6P81_004442 [Aristolochia fimbriata]|uniref:Uncharacterized protein n=1 Tax=Aristolochia fimbriata TaxID=158543 RepID=A0AAV7FGY2_ARIFI|nr:hypothetical protein H6P81_004442 [Aristolochia fimbriata]
MVTIQMITFKDVSGSNIRVAGILEGISFSNISLGVTSKRPRKCSMIQGYSDKVTPQPCEPLRERIQDSSVCYLPSDSIPGLSPGNQVVSATTKMTTVYNALQWWK